MIRLGMPLPPVSQYLGYREQGQWAVVGAWVYFYWQEWEGGREGLLPPFRAGAFCSLGRLGKQPFPWRRVVCWHLVPNMRKES